MKEKSFYYQFMVVIIAITCILYMNPFWVWTTYKYGSMFAAVGVVLILLALVFGCFGFFNKTISVYSLPFIMLLVYVYFVGEESQIGSIGVFLQYVLIILLLNLKRENIQQIFELYRKVLAIILIPSLVIFLFTLIGIKIPYIDVIDFSIAGTDRAYLHYPLTIAYSNRYTLIPAMRLCGFLDEPGKLGTIIGLILCVSDLKLKDIYNKILFICGLFTLSTAFYILVGVYFILRNWNRIRALGKRKLTIIALSISVAAVIFFLKRQTIIEIYNLIFLKLQVEDTRGGWQIWERTKYEFGDNIIKYIFGNGYYSCNLTNELSWQSLIYDIGFFGITLHLISYIVYTIRQRIRNKSALIFCFIFILSIIQREYVLDIPYFIIFIAGVTGMNQQINANRSHIAVRKNYNI